MKQELSTRNFGCRIRQFVQNGLTMLTLENNKIKIMIALGKGADIVELVHKETDTDCMWHSFNSLKPPNYIHTKAAAGGSFIDTYAGGWQELFPTYGAPTDYYGAEIGIHGEACIYTWDCEVLKDTPEKISVRCFAKMVRSPFLLEKVFVLENDSHAFSLFQKVENLAPVPLEFMWGHHPAYGYPFVEEGCTIKLNGNPHVRVPKETIGENCPFDEETEGDWPILPDKNGKPFDISKAISNQEKKYFECLVTGLEQGKYCIVNPKKRLGICMEWDIDVFPYLWVWGMYRGHTKAPWFGRAYTLAVEPWSSIPSDFSIAQQQQNTLQIEANGCMETEAKFSFYAEKEEEK